MPSICACAVVENRVICISVSGFGTYCFDTASHTWSRAGDWLLPFGGMAEYVPELNLWFGISVHHNRLLCAADLSAVARGQPPGQSFLWEDAHFPQEWSPCNYAQMVSLGCGRFCVSRFFQNQVTRKHDFDGLVPVKNFVVLNGLEVLAGKGKSKSTGSGNGDNGKIQRLRMIKHKSRHFNCSETCSVGYLL
jgi:hypothetical protein